MGGITQLEGGSVSCYMMQCHDALGRAEHEHSMPREPGEGKEIPVSDEDSVEQPASNGIVTAAVVSFIIIVTSRTSGAYYTRNSHVRYRPTFQFHVKEKFLVPRHAAPRVPCGSAGDLRMASSP